MSPEERRFMAESVEERQAEIQAEALLGGFPEAPLVEDPFTPADQDEQRELEPPR